MPSKVLREVVKTYECFRTTALLAVWTRVGYFGLKSLDVAAENI
jgi:hypothetical protein